MLRENSVLHSIRWLVLSGCVVLCPLIGLSGGTVGRDSQRDETWLPSSQEPVPHKAIQGEGLVMSPGLRSSVIPSRSAAPGIVFFQSGFEEDWTFGAPPGWIGTTPNSDSSWHRNDYTTGWSNAAGFVTSYRWSFMGGFSARFHTAGTPAGRRGVMITPTIDLSTATDSVFVSFWWTNSSTAAGILDSLKVLVSTDGGSTFPIVVGFVGPTGNPWLRAIGYISTHSAATRIKFQANGDGGSTDILIDEVLVFQKGSGYSEFLTLPGTFSSFTDASRRLSTYGVVGPTIINVAPGVYADSVTFPSIAGVSSENPVAFLANGGPVTIQRGGVQTASTTTVGATVQRTDDATISLWGADHMYFDGIGISDRPGSTQNEYGYYIRSLLPVDGATDNTITNCTIVMNKSNASTHGILQETFWVLTNSSGANSNNRYYNNTIKSCALRGISLVGYAPFMDVNNEIASMPGGQFTIYDVGVPNSSPAAVQISSQIGPRVHGLLIDSMSVFSFSLPVIFVGGSTAVADTVKDFEIYDNTIRQVINFGTGIDGVLSAVRIGFSSTNPSTVFTGKVYNNVVNDFRAYGTRPDGIIAFYNQSTAVSNVEWYHNTVLVDNMVSGSGGGSIVFRVNSGSATVRNNVFINNSGQFGTGSNYVYMRAGGTLVASHNDVFVDTTQPNRFIGTDGGFDYRRLSDWQASSPGRDTLSVSEFPHFINAAELPYNLHINPLLNTRLETGGLILPSVVRDIDGNPRYPNSGFPVNLLFPPNAPDIGADEFGGIPLDLAPPTIVYTLLSNTSSLSNRSFGNVGIADLSGVNGLPGTRPRVYFKKSTNNNVFIDNTSGTNGWKFVEASGSSSPFSFTLNYSLLFPNGSVAVGESVQYFVVAQDLTSPANVAINAGTFASLPSSVALAGSAFPIGGSINSYVITANTFAGAYDVGAGQTYTTLTAFGGLFSALNGGVVTGNITVNIVSDIVESGTNALNALSEEGGSGFTMLVRPSGGTRTLSGNTNGALFDLNGTGRITFDGNLSAVPSLRIRNSNAGANATTFLFRGNASVNTLMNCIIEGGGSGDSAGTIMFGSGPGGNRFNVITGNEIRDRSDSSSSPTNAIYSASPLNSSNIITNNKIYNWTMHGVKLPAAGAGNGWTISSNSFYQTASRSTPLRAVAVESGSRHTIANNSIGGSGPDRSGAPLSTSYGTQGVNAVKGVFLAVGSDSATTVRGNVLGNILCTSSIGGGMTGIHVSSGQVNVVHNTIGGGGNAWDTVNAVTDVRAIQSNGASGVFGAFGVLIDSNLIGNIRTRDSLLYGISLSGSTPGRISNNIIRNLTSSSTAGGIRGINVSGGNVLVEKNAVSDLRNTSTGTAATITVAGIHLSGGLSSGPSNQLIGNNVFTLSAAGSGLSLNSPKIWGIYVASSTAVAGINNMVALGTGIGGDSRFIGIEDAGSASNKWYYNSVSVTGLHAVAGTNGSIGFYRTGSARDTLRNNILSNTRTRGSRAHVAIANDNAANWTPGTSDYNIFFSTNTDSAARWLSTTVSLTGWRASTGGDVQTVFGDPLFVSATNLHIRTDIPSPANNTATPIAGIATDFDGDPRHPATPDKGADEFAGALDVADRYGTLPDVFKLEQNYPNPFNPTTSIRFQIPEASHVTVWVFDILGRKVATPLNDDLTPGFYSMPIDARAFSSGVYFYRLQAVPKDGMRAGDFTQTRKMLLLR